MRRVTNGRNIWIDLDNSPHVPFFAPIIKELEMRGYGVTLTARDCFQVCGLADLHNLRCVAIGKHYGKNIALKGAGTVFRALQLLSPVSRAKPDLSLSHGSRSQVLVSKILGIKCVMILDYEHSKGVILVHPHFIIIPELLKNAMANERSRHLHTYPGIKEDVYVPDFVPDPNIIREIGIHEGMILTTIRPPATEAHYRNPESQVLFTEVVDYLVSKENVQIVMLPRNEKPQGDFIRSKWANWVDEGKIIIPKKVIKGLNLIWHSDLVISGGGTMNREAAALGVPVYSIFRGKIGAVDRYLSEKGRLILIENKNEICSKIVLARRDKSYKTACSNNVALQGIVSHIVNIIEGQYV